ncbi:MAG TPA: lipopolysaccharide biosynthesis protein, partial [Planctomycetes bacterium]|nr:lipopolysaccharide biosynthesis protein [Planctomycetota bacterium]
MQIPAGSVLRGAVTVGATRAFAVLVGFANMFVLMRLLSPADFGVVDMVATLIAFLSVGSNLGLSAATVQSREVSHPQLSTLFWVNALFGAGMWAVCVAAGPLVSWFYKEPALLWVVALMGMSFFWGGLSAQSHALLQRHMRFVRMGAADVGGQLAGMTVAVFMAWNGYRYWSIACGTLTASAVSSVGALALAGFVPGLPKRGTGARAKLRYGGWLVGFNFLNYFNRNLDNVIIGRVLGGEQLGYYARAYRLYLFPLSFINSVAAQVMFPVLSRMQDDRKRLADTYAGLLGILVVTASTLAAWMGILAEEIMSLFGPQWMPAVPVFRILALVGVIQPIMNISGVAFLATNNTKTMFWWGLYTTPVYITAFLTG